MDQRELLSRYRDYLHWRRRGGFVCRGSFGSDAAGEAAFAAWLFRMMTMRHQYLERGFHWFSTSPPFPEPPTGSATR